jgi:hypothetical protein
MQKGLMANGMPYWTRSKEVKGKQSKKGKKKKAR